MLIVGYVENFKGSDTLLMLTDRLGDRRLDELLIQVAGLPIGTTRSLSEFGDDIRVVAIHQCVIRVADEGSYVTACVELVD